MTSQKFGVLHVLVKTLSYNESFDWEKIPKKVWKAAAKDYDEYLHLFRSEVGFQNFETSKEKRILQSIFEKLNSDGYYRLPESYYSTEITNAN